MSHIKKAIANAESGSCMALLTGKVARKKEREAATAQKEARIALAKLSMMGASAVNIEDKYRFVIAAPTIKAEGAADSA